METNELKGIPGQESPNSFYNEKTRKRTGYPD